jgi:endogenous inhibitor of DNA gyrase (YacG/DUF329 family)
MTDDKNRPRTASRTSSKAARSAAPEPAAARCPICGKPTAAAFRPFCSKRCADVDLQRWLSGRYAIPVVEEDAGLDDESSDDREA